jgi:hypothetical protein
VSRIYPQPAGGALLVNRTLLYRHQTLFRTLLTIQVQGIGIEMNFDVPVCIVSVLAQCTGCVTRSKNVASEGQRCADTQSR